jgi:hypothetical protein
MTDVEVHDGWSPLDDLMALHSAEDADELRRRLILYPAAPGNSADAFEPWCLLHAVHKDEPDGAAATALLLLTDRRWRNAAGRLIRRIEESDLIPADHLDLLAQTFLAADAQVYWEVPADWFDGPAIVIDFDDDGSDDEVASDELDESDDGPVVVARDVRPPLRRWAAGRALCAEPTCWSALVMRARELDARSGAAVLSGILDSVDVLAPRTRDLVLGLAERWPHRKVREAATALRDPPEPAAAPVTEATDVRAAAALSTPQPSLF